MMTLLDCPYLREQRAAAVGGEDLLCLGLRLGICPGARLRVLQRLPGGTTIVQAGRRELAVGRGHAACVLVEDCEY